MLRESGGAGENASPAAGFAQQSAITQREEKAFRLERDFQQGLNGAPGSVTWGGPESGPSPFWVLGGDIKWLLSHARAALGGLYSRRLMSLACSNPGGSGRPAQTWERFLSPRLGLQTGRGCHFVSPFNTPDECLG